MLLALLFGCFAFAAPAWNVHDLSMLLPLPAPAEEAKMLAPNEVLLPEKIFLSLPTLLLDIEPKILYRDHLRVVAIRIDPCFRENAGPCQRQIRFVWQPIKNENGLYTSLDAAAHTFYSLDEPSFRQLIRELDSFRKPITAAALGIHPVLAEEGYGAYWEKIRTLVTKYATHLSRVTVMTVNPRHNIWNFSGLDIVNGEIARITIPGTGGLIAQTFFAGLRSAAGEFQAAMSPEPPGEEEFLALLKNSRKARVELPEAGLIAATRRALSLENPRLSDPGTVSCASCHGAHVIPTWASKNFSWNWDTTFAAELFRLAGTSPSLPRADEKVNVLRAFGYFDNRPIISPRMANEAALALEELPH